MPTLVICKRDPASMLAGRYLTEKYFEPTEKEFGRYVVHTYKNADLIVIDTYHTYAENLHEKYPTDMFIFLSQHSSEQGTPAITVHPIGNFGDAMYGGHPRTLVKAPAAHMLAALKYIRDNAPEGYSVNYEVTHHGPYVGVPAFYIEVGSTEKEWEDEDAVRVMAEAALRALDPDSVPVAIGVGGGHYAPRFTQIALKKEIAFGHMLPRYVPADTEILQQMVDKTLPAPEYISIHGKYPDVEKWAEEKGMELVGE